MRDKASATALMIAESYIFLSFERRFRDLLPERAVEWCRRFAHEAHGDNGCRWEFYASLLGRVASVREALSVPGIRLHYAVRKRFIEDAVRDAVAEGFEQIVVVAAGFDTLALRLSEEFPGARFFELDHPATQAVKMRAIDEGLAPENAPENLAMVPIDLRRQSPFDVLSTVSSFRADRSTVMILEGILMYLTGSEVDRLLRSMATSGDKRRIIFSFLERQKGGRIGFRQSTFFTTMWLAWKGEPFRWGIREEELSTFLDGKGLHLKDRSTAEVLRQRYLSGALRRERLAEGEHVAVADN